MKARKIIATMLATVMAAGMLASCGGGTTESGKVSLSVGGWPINEGKSLDDMNKKKDDFEAQYTDIEIVPDTWTWDIKTFYPKAEAGQMPDLFYTFFTEFQKLTDGDYVADLTDAMKETGYWDNMNPKLRDLCSKDGRIYAMPTQAYALGISYNVKLFEQAGYMEEDGTPKQPKDWYELAEMAKHIKEVTGVPGFALETSGNCGGWFMTNIGWSFGVDWMEQQEDGSWKATFDTQEAVDTLQYIKDLKWKYDCVPANNIVSQDEAIKLYATGQTAMILDGVTTDRIGKYEMDINDYGMMALPAGPAKHVALLGGALTCMPKNATPEQIDAAFKWQEFTGVKYSLAEDRKASVEEGYITNVENGTVVGVKAMSPWNDDSESVKFRNEMIDKYCNINPNHVRLYNESLKSSEMELQAEEPVCCQDLYGILDNIIQEVYSNENADCAALIKQANSDFQKNYLDKLDY